MVGPPRAALDEVGRLGTECVALVGDLVAVAVVGDLLGRGTQARRPRQESGRGPSSDWSQAGVRLVGSRPGVDAPGELGADVAIAGGLRGVGFVPDGAMLFMTAELALPVRELAHPAAEMLIETSDSAEFSTCGLDTGAACQTSEAAAVTWTAISSMALAIDEW